MLWQRSNVASGMLYAAFGVVAAEFLLVGIQYTTQPKYALRFGLELCIVFISSAVFIVPVLNFVRARLERHPPAYPAPASLSLGVLGLAGVVTFIGFNTVTTIAFEKGAGSFLYLLLWPLNPAIVTLGWILGSRRPGRAWLYGALAGFSADLVVGLAGWLVTHTPADFGTALVAIVGGGIQAGFYGGCGGLALDLRDGRPVRNLVLALFGAIGIWTIGFRVVGGALRLPYTSELGSFAIRLLDYGGWVFGLALCPTFVAALQGRGAGANVNIPARPSPMEARLLRVLRFVPCLICFDLIFFVLALNKISEIGDAGTLGYLLAILSAVMWLFVELSTQAWIKHLIGPVALCAAAALVLLAPSLGLGPVPEPPGQTQAMLFTVVLCNVLLLAMFLITFPAAGATKFLGNTLAIFSGVAWQLSVFAGSVWSARFNVLAGLFAVTSVVLLVQERPVTG